MSLLAPLFFLGALAIGLPIVFHLIRREPKNKIPFSSLLFLDPSPPRISRRSRIDQWLLLLIRAIALLLIAAAFTRPFWRSSETTSSTAAPRFKVILLDQSASMQRGDLWQQATSKVLAEVESLQPQDRLAVMTYDSQNHTLHGFDDLSPTRLDDIRKKIAAVNPTWLTSNLGLALVVAAESLDEVLRTNNQADAERSIVVVSDLQSGSLTQALQGFPWPERTVVRIAQVALAPHTNATVYAMQEATDSANASDEAAPQDGKIPLRVSNAADSLAGSFELRWKDRNQQPLGNPIAITVPPGTTRVIRVPQPFQDTGPFQDTAPFQDTGTSQATQPSQAAVAIELSGDDQSFDNLHYTVVPPTIQQQVWFVGDDVEDPRESLLYYLQRVRLTSPQRVISVNSTGLSPDGPPLSEDSSSDSSQSAQIPLIVLHSIPDSTTMVAYQDYVRRGGRLLVVLDQQLARNPSASLALQTLFNDATFSVGPVESSDYALLTRINFASTVFRKFADPRFSDFSKIQFWKHAKVQLGDTGQWSVLAWFDDQNPALLQRSLGRGDWFVLAAGWQPSESQLALSTKFVPLIAALVGDRGFDSGDVKYELGNPTPLLLGQSLATDAEILAPNGQSLKLGDSKSAVDDLTEVISQPGIYTLRSGELLQPFSVNLASQESLTEPMDQSVLEQLGVRFTDLQKEGSAANLQITKRDNEIESSQQWWRVLLITALGFIAIETWISSRRKSDPFNSVLGAR